MLAWFMVKEPWGLTSDEVLKRLEKYGRNRLKEKKQVSWFKVLLSQFKSPLIYILVLAAGVTVVVGDAVDAMVIGTAVVLNTILGFYQEMKAERSLEALSKMLTPKAKVIRDGERRMVEAEEVVPGDICVLELGERVPADGKIVDSNSFSVSEAILTGESVPVRKGKGKEVFMGTTVSSGWSLMEVVKTGDKTAVGKIADSLMTTEEEPTPLQKQIGAFSKKLAIMVGGVCLVVMIVGLLVGDPFIEMFTTAVALAVSAIPEGLAVSLTVILALGMQRIFKRKSLVRKLLAAETLGSVTVICTDKTGTLTEGKMRVVKGVMEGEKRLIQVAILGNNLEGPLEIGMMEWAEEGFKELGKEVRDIKDLMMKYPKLQEIPFDPKNKYKASVHKLNGKKNLLIVVGAPEVVIARSNLKGKEKERWLKKIEEEAKKGLRLLGVSYKEVDKKKINDKEIKNLDCVGYLAFEDPIREGVKESLQEARKAGIQVKVITGDYKVTAETVMNQLGLTGGELKEKEIMEGYELEKMSHEEFKKKVKEVVLFARTNPEQKLKIVTALQDLGEVVAMTGDGVNDAPAVKKADIGIVVDDASAVAKETADMVLMDSNFATIVAAVEEGRGIFANLRKIILYLLSDSFSEVILVLGSMIVGLPLPISAAQILWINLVDDGLPDFALTLEPKQKDLMREKPLGHKRELLDMEIKWLIGLISLVTGCLSLGLFWWYLRTTGDMALARTVVFATLGIDSLLYVFSCKSLKEPLWQEHWMNNKWLLGAVGIGGSLQMLAIYLPGLQRLLKTVSLGMNEWLVVFLTNLLVIVMIEAVKWRFNHLLTKDK